MAAKGNNNQPNDRSRIRFVLLEVDGGSADLQQAAMTIAAAIRPPQSVIMQLPPALPAGGAQAPPAVAPPQPQNDQSPGLFDNLSAEAQPAAEQKTSAPKPQSAVKRKHKAPTVIPNLDFTSGAKLLKDYVEEVAPRNHSKRYLAITYWLREYRSVAEVGANHVYSCYRALGMNVPADVLSIFRDLKKQGWVDAGTAPGTYKLNHIGEGQLNRAKS